MGGPQSGPIRPGLRWILAPNPSPMTLDGTRTYLVGRRQPVVVDPGPLVSSHIDRVVAELAGAVPVAIVLTHSHPDHAGAAGDLARATGGPIWMAPGATAGPRPPPPIDHLARDGDSLRTDAGELHVIHTPGHAPEHLCLIWPPSEAREPAAAFVGDLFMGQGFTTLIAPPDGNLGAYLAALDRIESLDLDVLFPAHGEPLIHVAKVVARYRSHRGERLAQVRQALEGLPTRDLDAIVTRVYGAELDERLREAARGSVTAMLEYLRLTA